MVQSKGCTLGKGELLRLKVLTDFSGLCFLLERLREFMQVIRTIDLKFRWACPSALFTPAIPNVFFTFTKVSYNGSLFCCIIWVF